MPHMKTPEARQLVGLLLLLLMLVVFFFMFKNTTPRALTKVFPARTAGAPSSPDAIPVLLAMEPKAAPKQVVAFHGAFDNELDGVDFAETTGWLQILKQLRDTPSEEIAAKTGGRVFDHALALSDSSAQRGEYVKVHGVVADVQTVKVRDETSGFHDVWRVFLTDMGQQFTIVDLATEPPHKPDLIPRRDRVEIDAVSFRTVTYEAKNNSKQTAPYLLARDLKVVGRNEETAWFSEGTTRMIAIVAFTVIFGFVYMMSRRRLKRGAVVTPVGFKEMFERKMREERMKPRKPTDGNDKTDSSN